MSKRKEPNEVLVTKITNTAAGLFSSFGGGQVTEGNPVSHALKDAPPMFAAGVDISAVVRLTLIMSGQPDLLEACKLMQAALTEYHLRGIKKRYSLCVAAMGKAITKATS